MKNGEPMRRRVWTIQYLEREQKSRERYFISQWRGEFIRIENDCKIELPFNPKTLAVHSPSEIIPYIKMANEHHKKYKKTKLYKMCRFILELCQFTGSCIFLIVFVGYPIWIPVLMINDCIPTP